jgi:FKBP-type peptidyl-prolyl cis-trans isomerase FklB
MTLPPPRRGRTFLVLNAALLAALMAGAPLAQTPPAAGAPGAAAGAGTAKKPSGGTETATGGAAEKSAASYSLGVSMGEQLRATGVSAAAVSSERIAQGVRDGLAGKAKMTDADRERINKLVRSAYDAAGDANHRAAATFLAANGKKPGVVTTASGLQYKVVTPGSGDSPKATDEVTVNYRGKLLDGSEFDSSYARGQAATFTVNRVIPGWTEALQLMKPGAKYELFVPPQLAYDLRVRPGMGIPPGSMLIFDVELVSFKSPAATPPAPALGAPPTGAAPHAAPATPPSSTPAQPK